MLPYNMHKQLFTLVTRCNLHRGYNRAEGVGLKTADHRRLPQTTVDNHRTHRRTLQDCKNSKKRIFAKITTNLIVLLPSEALLNTC